jgi:flavin-dependent dehydrogenase
VVVGGGPVGLATAIYGRLAGMSVAVVERRTPPLDKACGEGVMPAGVRALAEMGVELEPSGVGPFVGIRFVDAQSSATGYFGTGSGWGVRRTRLVAALTSRAQALGAELCFGRSALSWRNTREGVRLETSAGDLEARFLVGADGLHSLVRQRLGAGWPSRGPVRFGVRRHYTLAPWSSLVEVHWAQEVEAYVTPVGPSEVGVALLWQDRKASFDELIKYFPALSRKLEGVPLASAERGAGPLRQSVARRVQGRVALVGDAGGYIDALSGEGLSLGWRCARALVQIVAAQRPLADFERACARLSRTYVLFTELLLQLAHRPTLRARVIDALGRDAQLFGRLLDVVGGDLRLTEAGLGALGRLVWRTGAGFFVSSKAS